jgi:hypothetical protein
MRRRLIILAAALAAPVAFMLPQANAAEAELCYDIDVVVEGTPVAIDQAGCLPE